MRGTFVRESIGINPLRSRRDWLVLIAIVAVIAAILAVVTADKAGSFARGVMMGALLGGLPSLVLCLPVRGRVAAENRVSFIGRVEQAGFVQTAETAEGRIYTPKSPRWMNWDSNRIVVRDATSDALLVTAPLQFYFTMKRRQL